MPESESLARPSPAFTKCSREHLFGGLGVTVAVTRPNCFRGDERLRCQNTLCRWRLECLRLVAEWRR